MSRSDGKRRAAESRLHSTDWYEASTREPRIGSACAHRVGTARQTFRGVHRETS